MRKVIVAFAGALLLAGCKKVGDDKYEIQKPVVGTVTDTVSTPSVGITSESSTIAVPKVEVKKESATVNVPKVKVKR